MADPKEPKLSPWPTTHWTLIDLMADSRGEDPSDEEIGVFLADYLPPLRAYLIHRRGLTVHDAEDLLQEFILQRFLSKGLASHVDQSRGKFRTFLLTSLDNFLRNQYQRDQAQKRAPKTGLKPLPDGDVPASTNTPPADDLFEIEWARMIVRQTIEVVKQHCEQTNRPEVWQAFEARVIAPILEHAPPVSNDELAKRFGMDSPQQVSNAIVTAKRVYQRGMYGVIMKYARDKNEVEEELAELRRVLAKERS
ncbi:MAG: hypothetical protein AAGB26_10340 [Planctomycetota bacterium]